MGIVVAAAGLRGIIAMVPSNTIPDEAQIALNMPVLLFTLAVSITAAFCFGLAPALNLSGGDILTPLREGGRGTAGGMRQRVLRGSLVVCEVALSLMLLVGASLMVRTLLSIQGKNIGFDPDTILTVRVPPSEQRYASAARRAALFREALQRIRTVPGVRAASINWGLPPVFTPGWPVSIVGSNLTESRRVLLHQTDQHYLEVLGTPLLQGRFLESQDVNSSAHSAVVNQTFVRRYFAGVGAIGHLVRIPSFREAPWSLADDSFLIVGIVADTVNQVSSNEIWPELYVPFTGSESRGPHFCARGRPGGSAG